MHATCAGLQGALLAGFSFLHTDTAMKREVTNKAWLQQHMQQLAHVHPLPPAPSRTCGICVAECCCCTLDTRLCCQLSVAQGQLRVGHKLPGCLGLLDEV